MAEEATGHPVAVFQRIDQAGFRLPIDERILADTDTLMVFGLDHLLPSRMPHRRDRGDQAVAEAGGHLPLLAPHHDVGFTDDFGSARWNINITATRWCRASSGSGSTRDR